MANKLRLKAQDNDDLTIISAYLQDAVTVVGDFNFRPKERLFVMMLNRYIWEDYKSSGKTKEEKNCHRIRTGCHFENIINVTVQNIPQDDKKHILELLAIESSELENGNIAMELIFAAEAVIKLEAELIEGQMEDIGEPYPAACHPKHEIIEILS